MVRDISPPCERGDTADGGGGIPFPVPLASPFGGGAPAGGGEGFPGKKEIPRRGIDFFPYHVILKIKRGAAGRREPLGITFGK